MKFVAVAALAAVGILAPIYAAPMGGKQVFEKTCHNSHGPEGKGSPTANSFWKVNIPRLDSKYVQDKKDAELRKIITGGMRKMEPVRMDMPTAPHRRKLTSTQIDSVIAYLRTLKAD